MVWLIRLYQRWISPALGPRCRFSPTCSSYAAQALTRHGLLRGLGLTTWRVLRCQPFSAGGLDPVPERRAPRSTAAQPPQPAQPARPAPTARPAPGPAPHLDPLRSAARSRS